MCNLTEAGDWRRNRRRLPRPHRWWLASGIRLRAPAAGPPRGHSTHSADLLVPPHRELRIDDGRHDLQRPRRKTLPISSTVALDRTRAPDLRVAEPSAMIAPEYGFQKTRFQLLPDELE